MEENFQMNNAITIFGVGALGSKIGLGLGYIEDLTIRVIDSDRVSSENVLTGTSAYQSNQIGMPKVKAFSQLTYLKYRRRVEEFFMPVDSGWNDDWQVGEFSIDCFDNFASRKIVAATYPEVLHVGVGLGTGAVLWNDGYAMGEDVEGEAICTNQLGVPIIDMTVAAALVAAREYIFTGKKMNAVTTKIGIRWL